MEHSMEWTRGYKTAELDINQWGLKWAQDTILGADPRCEFDEGYIAAVARCERSELA